jgi:hypothetical protein
MYAIVVRVRTITVNEPRGIGEEAVVIIYIRVLGE